MRGANCTQVGREKRTLFERQLAIARLCAQKPASILAVPLNLVKQLAVAALDNITMFFLTGFAHLGLAAALWVFRHSETDKRLKRIWLWGHLAGAFGMILLLGRREDGLNWLQATSNALIYVCLSAHLLVTLLFFGHALRAHWWWLATIVGLQFVFRPFGLTEQWRLAAVVSGSLLIFGTLCTLYWRHRHSSYSMVRFLLPLNGLVFALVLIRFIEIVSAHPEYSFAEAGWGQTLGIVGLFINAQTNGVGFLLLLKERADQELQRLSSLDPLTDLSNRRAFISHAKQQLALADRGIHPVSVLICDIDHFKQINDRHGHHAGDDVIRALAQLIRHSMRAGDSGGRWGGEEFVILLPQTQLDGALQFATRLNRAFAQVSVSSATQTLHNTISIGVTEHQHGEDIQTSIDRADSALYRAKQNGRNRVEFAAVESKPV